MLSPDTGIFLQVPTDTSERILRAATVIEAAGEQLTARCDEDPTPFEAGMETLVYFDRGREFLQRACRVDDVIATDGNPEVRVTFVGEPVSADGRQCFRVSTVTAELHAHLEQEQCPLMDVSATGFSVTSSTAYKQGQQVKVVLNHDDETFAGLATVQSIKSLADGRTRYGLHCGDKKNLAISNGLVKISMGVQRLQLRRRAGAV